MPVITILCHFDLFYTFSMEKKVYKVTHRKSDVVTFSSIPLQVRKWVPPPKTVKIM